MTKSNRIQAASFVSERNAGRYSLPAVIAALSSGDPAEKIKAETDLQITLQAVADTLDGLSLLSDASNAGGGENAGALSLLAGVLSICADASLAIAEAHYFLKHGGGHEKD